MTSATKASSAVSSPYAIALVDLAEKATKIDAVEKDLKNIRAMIKESADLSFLIRSPLVSRAQQQKALFTIADKAEFQTLTRNFLGVLVKNGRLNVLEPMIDAFYAELSRRRGEISVSVETAQPLGDVREKSLQDAISAKFGSQVTLNARVNPRILGGMIVTVGSQMIDNSVSRKLERLKTEMTKTTEESAAA